ncbi:YdcF family protein [Actinobacillus vicugnae]|uniref:YdcF family protein n=1 Tax=Actinobacillus vicugnae TaxID=2573093 RepID=UPI00123F6EDB|nr:YdcF family protein [Actinobacillus vicugnae]
MLFLTKLVTAIILPPFNALILWIFSLLLHKLHFKKLGYFCTILGITILYICSTPYFSSQLIQAVTFSKKFTIEDYKKAQAIVLLGGGLRDSDELFGRYAIAAAPLERMRYAAYLHKQTGLPILVTGGSPEGRESEAKVMAQELHDFFQTPVRWIEPDSNVTEENATFSKPILNQAGVKDIVLVTNQWHMKRAKMLFEREGFTVLAASTTAHQALDIGILPFIPQAQALQNSSLALKEWLGYWKEKLLG